MICIYVVLWVVHKYLSLYINILNIFKNKLYPIVAKLLLANIRKQKDRELKENQKLINVQVVLEQLMCGHNKEYEQTNNIDAKKRQTRNL